MAHGDKADPLNKTARCTKSEIKSSFVEQNKTKQKKKFITTMSAETIKKDEVRLTNIFVHVLKKSLGCQTKQKIKITKTTKIKWVNNQKSFFSSNLFLILAAQ